MILRLVPEILPCDAFCDEQQQEKQEQQELGILGVRLVEQEIDPVDVLCTYFVLQQVQRIST